MPLCLIPESGGKWSEGKQISSGTSLDCAGASSSRPSQLHSYRSIAITPLSARPDLPFSSSCRKAVFPGGRCYHLGVILISLLFLFFSTIEYFLVEVFIFNSSFTISC